MIQKPQDMTDADFERYLFYKYKNEGDLEARDTLYNLFQKFVGSIIRQMRIRQNLDVDNIYQEASLHLFTVIDTKLKPKEGYRFSTLLYLSIRRKVSQLIAKENRKQCRLVSTSTAEDSILDIEEKPTNIADTLDNQVQLAILQKEINKLPKKRKDILLSWLGGLNYTELSKRYNVSPQAIRTMNVRTFKHLKEKVNA